MSKYYWDFHQYRSANQDTTFAQWAGEVFTEQCELASLGISTAFRDTVDVLARLPIREKQQSLSEYICFIRNHNSLGLLAIGDIAIIRKLVNLHDQLRTSPYSWLFFDNKRQVIPPRQPNPDFVEFVQQINYGQEIWEYNIGLASKYLPFLSLIPKFLPPTESFPEYLLRLYRFYPDALFLVGDFAREEMVYFWILLRDSPFAGLFIRKEGPSGPSDSVELPIDKNKSDDEGSNDCVVCFEPIASKFALLPCGHTQTCECCIPSLKKICPICRTPIATSVRIY